MITTDLTRPYPFSIRPLHKETIDSYSRRLLDSNFETVEHRRGLERLAQATHPQLSAAERWRAVVEAKSGRPLSTLQYPPATGLRHSDGTTCAACSEGITHRVMCTLCANGAVVEQHPHLDQNVCLPHRRWVGPNTGANQQVTVGDDAIRAEIRFRKLRRAGFIDAPFYMLLQNTVTSTARDSDLPTLYPMLIALASGLTSYRFGETFFDPRNSFDDAYMHLTTTVQTALGFPHADLTALLWMRFRPTVLSLRESIEQNQPFQPGSAHDLPISRSLAHRFQTQSVPLEPFTGYLEALPTSSFTRFAPKDVREVQLYAASTSATRGSIAMICDKGHRSSRVLGSTCPTCTNRVLCAGFNDLSSVRTDIGRQWHPRRNGATTARDVFPACRTKYWWLCDEGHDFRATPFNRTSVDSSCPVCLNREILGGINDFGTFFPHLAVEWDYAKNSNHAIETIAPTSNLLAWWKCPVGHSYRMAVSTRTRGSGCHHCPRIASRSRTIAIARPDLAPEFHCTANHPLTPETVTIGSRKRCEWTCPEKGHQYTQLPQRRNAGYGCPYCSGQKFERGINAFSTMFPQLAIEWHQKRNGVIEASDHIARSRKVWWKCVAERHEQFQTIQARIMTGGCPVCDPAARPGSSPRAS